MGGISSILSMIPGSTSFADKIQNSQFNDNTFDIQKAIIYSMTELERSNPNIINMSRKKRMSMVISTHIIMPAAS